MKKRILFTLLTLMMFAVMTACGGDPQTEQPTPTTEPTQAPATPTAIPATPTPSPSPTEAPTATPTPSPTPTEVPLPEGVTLPEGVKLMYWFDGEERTQKEVADILGISQSYISRLEKKIIRRLRREVMKAEI